MDTILNALKVEEVKEKPNLVTLVFSQDTSQTIDGSALFKKAYLVDRDISFEYRNKKIIMNIKKSIKDKIWINKVILILESFCI